MYYQVLGLLFVLSLPILVVFFARSNLSTKPNKKSKKKKKKNKSKSTAAQSSNESPSVAPSSTLGVATPPAIPSSPIATTSQPNTSSSSQSKSKRKQANKAKAAPEPTPEPKPVTTKQQPIEDASSKKPTEVDEHMDWTPKYSRVMRITREPEEDPFQPVPHEDGWNSVAVKKPYVSSSSRAVDNEPLTKKQRENQARAAKKRTAKAQADALQAERLRRHQRELQNRRIEEFYSTGAGKHTPWGKKPQRGSSKVPTAKAGLNENGQLIWD
ncbi:hypothetical protein K492DRAFT_236460 [Lichtheimia hyalospora FSU 10163]|nr:hypothetical protein K492DRAFT_236460 [Lichtheimia hyalospora FSU 10163]